MTTLDWHYKGLPLDIDELELADIGRQGWNVLRGDLPMPVMVLLRDPLPRTSRAMAAWCAERGLQLAPHGKSTMAPQIFREQLAAGAWGMTCATPWHLRVYREVGRRRGSCTPTSWSSRPRSATWRPSSTRDPDFEIYCLADSVAGVEMMQRELAAAGAPRPIGVLVEVGHEGGRCGCRTVRGGGRRGRGDHRRAAARAWRASRRSRACARPTDLDAALRASTRSWPSCSRCSSGSGTCCPRRPMLTAGGSAFFDRVAVAFEGRPVTAVLRSGCYVTQDGGHYDRVSPLGTRPRRPAPQRDGGVGRGAVAPRAEARADELRPPRRAVRPRPAGAASGWRATASAARWRAPRRSRLSDQHGHIRVPADTDIRPGDLLGATISHPCGAFDRWRLLPVVDDALRRGRRGHDDLLNRRHAAANRRPADWIQSAGMGDGRIEVVSIVDRVYESVRTRILDGSLERGARLRQEALAAELGVSRTPLREALRRLASEGLVELEPNRGARIPDLSRADMLSAYEARLALEPGAARAGRRQPRPRRPGADAGGDRTAPPRDHATSRCSTPTARSTSRSSTAARNEHLSRRRRHPLGVAHRRHHLRPAGRDAGAGRSRRRRPRAHRRGRRRRRCRPGRAARARARRRRARGVPELRVMEPDAGPPATPRRSCVAGTRCAAAARSGSRAVAVAGRRRPRRASALTRRQRRSRGRGHGPRDRRRQRRGSTGGRRPARADSPPARRPPPPRR